jgi:hypothetical protein
VAAPSLIPPTAMTTPPTENKGSKEFVKQSNLYQEFLAEREEILKHKWIESERLGYDIGFERALLDWIRKHRDAWRASRRAQLAAQQAANAPAADATDAQPPAGTPASRLPASSRK